MKLTEQTLGEICDRVDGVIRTGPFGSQLHASDYVPNGIPVIMPKNIADGRVSTEDIARVRPEDAVRLSQHVLQEGDIVYARRGDIGRHALITKREEGWLCGTGCLRVKLGDQVVYPEYLHYYLNQQPVIAWIANQAVGATMPNLNTDILRSIPVRYPPRSHQHKIASILSVYDDLIENNLRRIAILEEMAQAIYREWFVEFRYPGHEDSVLVKSECGLIPDGWEAMRLTDAVQVNPAVKVEKKLEKPYADMACLSTSSMIVQFKETRTGASGSKFKNGDTLVARITPCLENGKTGFVQGLRENEVALGSTEFIVLRSVLLCPEYVYLMARTDSFRQHAVKSMTGASGRQRVQIACFNDYLLAIPPRGLLDQFSMIAVPMFRQAWTLSEINDKLRQIRDLLLPRLISGELDVSDIAISTEEDNL